MKQLRLALTAVIMLAFAAPAFAQGALQGFVVHPMPKVIPEIHFQAQDGRTRTLAEFRGKVVLVNVWATWCGPCREEMPTLDRLQVELGGPDFEVVALSIDRGGFDVVGKFFAEVGVTHLAMYLDSDMEAASALSAVGLPISLLIDRDGTEIGRLIGPAKWDAPEMVKFIRSRLNKKSTSLGPSFSDRAVTLLPSSIKGSAS
jgi:thiol-disulfide isomerase/thioredoxin